MLRDLFFQAWGSLTSLKSQTRDPQLKFPPGGLVLGIFTFWKKIHRPQPGLNPRTLDLEAITLPREHRGRLLQPKDISRSRVFPGWFWFNFSEFHFIHCFFPSSEKITIFEHQEHISFFVIIFHNYFPRFRGEHRNPITWVSLSNCIWLYLLPTRDRVTDNNSIASRVI